MRRGLAVSPGIAVGKAYCIHEIFVGPDARVASEAGALEELARYDRAREAALTDLKTLQQKVARQVGLDEAAVFVAQQTILGDPAFTAKARDWIVSERLTAQAALSRLMDQYTRLFERTRDEYLKERLSDLRDIILRLSTHLSPALKQDSPVWSEPVIVVAEELLPSQVIMLGERAIAGVVTQAGGRTSHAAILARGRGIPAVSGVRGILRNVSNGDTVVVDGREGHVIINPDAETESAYRKLQREFVDLKDALAENREQPAISASGEPVELLANINNVADAQAAESMGASGVGLYRTEYLFIPHPDVPDEEEQCAAYREIIRNSPRQKVTIRTLDIGGDKTIAYFNRYREANPFMGWRSIRLSFEHPEFFLTQIRAVLRAAGSFPAGECDVRLLFPMITTLEEMRRVRSLVRRAERRLKAEGVPFARVPIGLMLEVPAAAISIDALLEVVDFVSIGSNDLVQYLMAADRDNPKVSHLCQPLSPAVLHVLNKVITACNQARIPVTLCGEMAGTPRTFVLLYGMGLRSFSMSPAFVPTMKEVVAHLSNEQAREILQQALSLKTSSHIIRYMGEQVSRICPNLKLMDSD